MNPTPWWTTVVLFLSITNPFTSSSQDADIDLLRRINLNRNESFDRPMEIVSDCVAPIGFAVPLTELTVGFLRHDDKLKTDAAVDALSLLGAYAVTYSLKHVADRERPYVTYPYLDNVVLESSPSFPSGHATNAFSTATSLSLAFKKWYVVLPAYAYAATVGYSRMHLGVHYPSDVLVGALVGSGTSVLCYEGQNWIGRKRALRQP
jgi:membrane-associated phospholipid phosphatase